MRNQSNVTALDPSATLDIEFLWDTDDDGVLNACGPVLLRGTTGQVLTVHIDNLVSPFVDDLPGSLSSNVEDYYYLINERGSPTVPIILEKKLIDDAVRVQF